MKEKPVDLRYVLKIFFFLTFQLCIGFATSAQNNYIQFEHITGKAGLPQNSIYAICQDKIGFLWFGTADGLCRYDGAGMKIYRADPTDSNSLPGNFIRRLLVDSRGNIWVGTESGICRFNPFTEKFKRVVIPSDKNYTNVAFPLCELPTGEILFGADKNRFLRVTLSNLNVAPEEFAAEARESFSAASIYSIYNCGNSLVFFENNKVDIYDYANNVLKSWPINDTAVKAANDIINHGDSLYIATFNSIIILNKVNGGFRNVKEININGRIENIRVINKLQISPEGYILIGTNDYGLLIADLYLQKAQQYIHKDNDINSISFNTVKSLFCDNSGNLWVGTDGKGLNKCSISNRFNLYNIQKNGKDFLSADFIRCFFEDNIGNLYVGTYGGGLIIINPERTHSEFYKYNSSDIRSLPDNDVLCILSDSKNNIWIGTEKGVALFNKKENNFERLVTDDKSKVMVTSMIETSPGEVLIGTSLLPYCLNTDSMLILRKIANNNLLNIVTLSKDKKAAIYAAVKPKYFEPGKIKFRHGKNEFGNFYCLYDAQNCYVDGNENIWVATKEGLDEWNKGGQLIKTFTVKDGLPDNYLYSILPDNNGNLWIGSNNGLSKFNMSNSTFRNYDITDGLQSNEFNSNAAYLSKTGEMFFGGINGFNAFYPDSIKDNYNTPANVITSCKIFSKEWVGDSAINSLHILTLPYFENTITFTVASLEFTQPDQNLISYRLLGLDTIWAPIGTERVISFMGLSPGNYILEVKSCNNDGIWNVIPKRLLIRIVPPIWKTIWFQSSCGILLIVLVVFIVRYFARRKLKAQLEEIKLRHMLEKERTRISQDMHDEIGSGLSKISILSELAGNKNMLPDERNEQMNKITSTSRQLVDNIQEIIWSLNPRNDTLVGLLSYMHEYANDFFDSTSIRLHFEYPVLSVKETAYVKNTARRNIFLAFKETLNNTVKHSGADEVNIKFSFDKNLLTIQISDNGKGIADADYAKNRNGLQNMTSRMKDCNGKVEITSVESKGTTVHFIIKMEKEIMITT